MILFAARLPRLIKYFTLLACMMVALIIVSCRQEPVLEDVSPQATRVEEEEPPAVLSPAFTATAKQSPSPTASPESVATPKVMATPTETKELRATQPPVVDEPTPTVEPEPIRDLGEPPDGALISVLMESQVGVLLDELPEEMRDQVAGNLLNKPEAYWNDLARRQVRLTKRRLNFRNFVYPSKGQLPLPPEELWTIELDPEGPQRLTIQNHDLVATNYIFSSTLLTDAESPGQAEPRLRESGGVWNEPYMLPADPDLLLQRTGNACLNEAGFPPNSFDSENAWVFYDYSCEGEDGGIFACHRTRLHSQSCVEALEDQIGTFETVMIFERLEWDPALAEQVRVGEVTNTVGPDLNVVGDDLEINRIIYRYFTEDSCALAEQCITGSGWRRLLQFNATVHNVGAVTLDIGPVVAQNPLNSLFQYNTCHAHYHFADYGDFYFTGEQENLASKQAFCVESTNRFSNNEWSPIIHDYTCRTQGVQAGWVDEYVAGLDCQWIDITDIEVEEQGSPFSLGFTSNPDAFLCEGSPILDDEGNPQWEPTDLIGAGGAPLSRPMCDFVPEWDVNNDESREVILLPSGTFVTELCVDEQLGPLRNCDFIPQTEGIEVETPEEPGDDADIERKSQVVPEGAFACEPGRPVDLLCSVEDDQAPQVLRLCDFSAALGVGVGCTFLDSLANEIISQDSVAVPFTCPAERDEEEPGGLFAMYSAPVVDDNDRQLITCEISQ